MTEVQPHRGLHLLDYWKVVVRRRSIMILFSVLVLITTALGTARQQKEYLATTVLHLDMLAPRVVDFDESSSTVPRTSDYQAFYNTQLQIINSRTVKLEAIKRLQAREYHEWEGYPDPVAAFAGNMQVNPIKDTRLVQIGYVHPDPAKAAEIANVVAEVYIKENLNRKIDAMKTADAWLKEQATDYLAKMKESDQELLAYKKDNDLLSMAQKENIFQKNLTEIYEIYNQARADRIASESEYRTLLNFYQTKQFDPLIAYFATDTVKRLKEQHNDVDRQYESNSERYLPRFPLMMQLDAERKILERKLIEELGGLMKGKEAEFDLRRNKEEALLTELTRTKQQAAELETRLVNARELINESERNERFFKQLDDRKTEVDLVQQLMQNSNIEVIDIASVPVDHIRPNPVTNMLLALLVSLSGGMGLAFAIEYLDRSFKSPDEVEAYLGVPLLGIFPLIRNETDPLAQDTYVFHNPRSAVAECCRSIRTNITLGSPGRRIRSLLITSASPQEGKSTLVVSIGITMAQANNRTLLIDTDLRRPRLHKVFNQTLDYGFTSIVNGTAGYDKSIFPTEIPNLFIMPSGPIPPNPSELLSSERMDQILEELKLQFDLIIFDSPPCIAVTDAVVLSTKTDGVIFVIKQDSTAKEAAVEAKRRLGELGGNLIGCIMNNIDIDRDSYGYRYYYYYHYYGEEAQKPGRRVQDV